MKKLVLASAAALVLAGAVVGTGEVRANSYSADSRYLTQNGSSRRDMLRVTKQNAKLQISNIRDSYKGYTSSQEARFYLIEMMKKRSEEEVNKVVSQYEELCKSRWEKDESFIAY